MSPAILPLLLSLAPAAGFPHPGFLLGAARPAQGTRGGNLRVRGKTQYQEGQIPGALWIDASAWGKAFTPKPDAEAWGKRVGELGIGPDVRVVVYGGDDVRDAARVWWILRYWGVKDVRLLNGGLPAWLASG